MRARWQGQAFTHPFKWQALSVLGSHEEAISTSRGETETGTFYVTRLTQPVSVSAGFELQVGLTPNPQLVPKAGQGAARLGVPRARELGILSLSHRETSHRAGTPPVSTRAPSTSD